MSATLNDVMRKQLAEESAEQRAATELVLLAKEPGLSLTGPDGLLKQLTKSVLETALNEEMTGFSISERRQVIRTRPLASAADPVAGPPGPGTI